MRTLQVAHFLFGVVSSVVSGKQQAEPNDGSYVASPTPFLSNNFHVPWTFQSSQSNVEMKRWSGRLDARQGSNGTCLYPDSTTGQSQYCPNGGTCCSSPTHNGCCASGTYCIGTERCCAIGTTACSTDLCCIAGATCCGNIICCAAGSVCEGNTCVDTQASLLSVQSVESIQSVMSVSQVSEISTASVASVSIASQSAHASNNKSAIVGGAVGGVLGGIALIAALAFLFVYLKKKNSQATGQTNNQPMLFQPGERSPYTPNSFKQSATGAYSGSPEVMQDRPMSFASQQGWAGNSPPVNPTPLPMRVDRARTTAEDHVASMTSFPYDVPPPAPSPPGVAYYGGASS